MALTKIKAAGLTADLIDETKLADNSIDSEHYNDGSIDDVHLANGAVTEAKIGALQVTSGKIANGAIGPNQLAADSVSQSELATNAVITENITDNAVTGAKLSDNLDIPDNNKIRFGTGNDLQIYHDGTDDIVHSTGTSLRTRSNIFRANNEANTAVMFRSTASAAFEANYDGSLKLETTPTGIFVSGMLRGESLDLQDNKKVLLGNDDDLQIYHDGSHSYIQDTGTGRLKVTTNGTGVDITNADGSDTIAEFDTDGAVKLYYDNAKKLETTSSGIGVTGTVASVSNNDLKLSTADNGADIQFQLNGTTVMTLQNTSKLEVNDNFEMVWGNGSDLRIKHDGSNTQMINATGEMQHFADVFRVVSASGSNENMLRATKDSSVKLYYNNLSKCETTAEGINVYTGDNAGAATGWGLQVFGGTSARTAPAIYLSGGVGNSDNSAIFSKYNLTLGCNQPTTISDRFVEFVNGNNRMGGFGTAGLTFGSDTADANALSDYEEGTWTPALTNGPSLINTKGYYTKIGRVVHAAFYIQTSTDGAAAHVRINNLPFTSAANNTSGYNGVGAGGVAWDYGSSSVRRGHVPSANTSLYFYHDTGGAMEGSNSNFEDKDFRGTAIYITD